MSTTDNRKSATAFEEYMSGMSEDMVVAEMETLATYANREPVLAEEKDADFGASMVSLGIEELNFN